MGDAVRGVMEVEERGVVGHFETSRWFSLSAAETLRSDA